MFFLSIALLVIALLILLTVRFVPPEKTVPDRFGGTQTVKSLKAPLKIASMLVFAISIISFLISMYAQVSPAHVGIITTLGKIDVDRVLPEGPHFIAPISRKHEVFTGVDVAQVKKADAGSRDTQSVWSDIAINFTVTNPLELFRINPTLNYEALYVEPAILDVFKAVASGYSAEELITKRVEVNDKFLSRLNDKLRPYHITVRTANLTNFAYSQSFNAAIEEKVAAYQKALTAERMKEKAKFDAESRVLTATGEATAIRIQAEAIEKSGGDNYVKLKWVEKWNGVQPQYQMSGQPLISIPAGK